ncbi:MULTISPECIES: acyl-CoA synthetase [Actinopolyspora]|uniref:Fatty-acyl-CoA synthase n=1 Tax=Actinopolyspora saharensis TaxID=995062 RepID=A0A1H0YU31_9ACTN|nr:MULTISPECIES: long-chain fatty acid--CoA ligase [Actinopolyspora]NHD19411.1 long-chain fatty acid--CoA ligase [Actinopolyspora sp. BKK2]NHE78516.1 long-chain fatty acid--CoA ligase [Actinopolyspora sp. BKK1]SDQ18431.1 fatty-acyl-CoA synthase [Actinopolyspora saharensis]
MRNQGLGSWPARRARSTPDGIATVHRGRTRTYGELCGRVHALANGLHGRGLGRGDRIAYLGPNHPALLETLFAAGVLGAVFVPLNTRLATDELAFMLDDSGAGVLVHDRRHAGTARALRERFPGLELVVVADDAAVADGFEALIAGASDEPRDEPVAAEDTALVLYTSGTTGRPKGARISHGNAVWNALNVVVDVDLTSTEVTLLNAPLFHSATLGMTCLPTLLKGGTVVLEEAFDVEATFDLIEQRRITLVFGVPTMFDALSRCPRWSTADLSSLRFLLCGGAPVPEELIRRYSERGLTFMQGYGMTEASPGVLLLSAADSTERVGCAGKPAFFSDVRLERADGSVPAVGEPGEVLVAGPNVVDGYWRRPGETAEAFTADGWFRSGDVATVDGDGFHRIVDRIKDMFVSGGENVYPAEVEAVLHEHPAVADVAVVGVPDPTWGEVGKAVVVVQPGGRVETAELTAFAAERLGKYKVPKSIALVDELPCGATGKVDKAALRREHG